MAAIFESVRLAIKTLGANRTRSILTMLGISIGVGAVIALMAMGSGVQKYINDQFASAGSNLVTVSPGQLQRGPPGGGVRAYLTENDYKAIVANAPNLVAHTAAVQAIGSLVNEGGATQAPVYGVTPSFAVVRNWTVQRGRFIDDSDNGGRLRVIVIGATIEKDLFGGADGIDQIIKLNNIPFRVIGVMQSKGSTIAGDQDAATFIPLATAQNRVYQTQTTAPSGERTVSTILLQTTDEKVIPQVESVIRSTLRERHRLAEDAKDDFTIVNAAQLLSTLGSLVSVLTIFLGAIAAISLLVGGIGIMNIMLVSVTERTREIGLRKAIGAKRRTILSQFLVEAIVLSMLGGIIGVLLGTGIAVGVRYVVDFTPVIEASSISLAVGFSLVVGLFFGIYPAFRASKLNPIDALRHE